VAPSPSRAPGWSAGPRSRRCSGCLEEASRPPTSTDFYRIADRRGTGIGRVAAARKLLTLVYYGLLRPARRPGPLPGAGAKAGDMNRCERLGRSPARARVCHDPARRRGRPFD
jgi:hypothetical protein